MTETTELLYPGLWATKSAPNLSYRVMPKCACSSIGQIFHYLDNGTFHDGDVHRAEAKILKWNRGWDNTAVEAVLARDTYRFTLVRNPYRRVLSAFVDKIFGYQSNGKRYRDGEIHALLQQRGLIWGPKSSILINFRKFLVFAAETIARNTPMPPDVHWSPCFSHLKFTYRKSGEGWLPQYIGHIETFAEDTKAVFAAAGVDPARLPTKVPRENSTSLGEIDYPDFYGPREIELVQRMYRADFELFNYSLDHLDTKPFAPVDVEKVIARIKQ